jgi:exonuclease SbcD
LEARFEHLVALQFAPPLVADGVRRATVVGRSDHEIALAYVAEIRGAPATEAESALLLDACEACSADPEADKVLA